MNVYICKHVVNGKHACTSCVGLSHDHGHAADHLVPVAQRQRQSKPNMCACVCTHADVCVCTPSSSLLEIAPSSVTVSKSAWDSIQLFILFTCVHLDVVIIIDI